MGKQNPYKKKAFAIYVQNSHFLTCLFKDEYSEREVLLHEKGWAYVGREDAE
jgi:hypothetical protein